MTGDAKNHRTLVIDRTLPEIRSTLLKMSRLDILELCWLLRNVGADFIEADPELLGRIGRLPEGLAFILKAGNVADLNVCKDTGIRRCVFRRNLLEQPEIAETIRNNNLYAVLEVRVNSIGGIRRLEALKETARFEVLSGIRITGLGQIDTPEWIDTIKRTRAILGKAIDICPDNRFSMGNAVALEAAMNGIDCITASFSGFGCDRSYAALEVVLSALKRKLAGGGKLNPEVLSLLYKQFTKCSRRKIVEKAPILLWNPADGWYDGERGGAKKVMELVDA